MTDNRIISPFDLYTRNRVIVQLEDEVREKKPLKILDVGGRGGCLNEFFRNDLYYILDTIQPKNEEKSIYIKGNCIRLPFKEGSFDVVTSSGMSGYISPEYQQKAILEMMRVSKNFVVLEVLFHSEVEKSEISANEFFLRCTDKQHPWLKEHIENLPSDAQLETFLRELEYDLMKLGTNNVFTWLALQLLIFYAHYDIQFDKIINTNRLYNENFAELGDFLEPTYRKIYLIGKKGTIPNRDFISKYQDRNILKQQRFDDRLQSAKSLAKVRDEEATEMCRIVVRRIIMKYQHCFVDRAMPHGTKLRRIYDRGLKGCRILVNEGPYSLWWNYRELIQHREHEKQLELDKYELWCMKNEPTSIELKEQKGFANNFKYRPLISIITPVFNTPLIVLEETIKSVIDQTYDNWEMCLVDGNSKDENIRKFLDKLAQRDRRIKVKYLNQNLGISGNSNEALKLAKGDFIAILDHDDLLAPSALFEIVKVLNKNHNLDFIYSDRDLVTADGKTRFQPFFKPDWSPEIMLSANYLAHLCVIRKSFIDKVGGFSQATDGAQDWDLFLKITEGTNNIYHISKVLYHWRTIDTSCSKMGEKAKPYAFEAQRISLENHLKRRGLLAVVVSHKRPGLWRMKWIIMNPIKVSIIIVSRNINFLKKCIKSILSKSSYKNFEMLVINASTNRNYEDNYNDFSKNAQIKVFKFSDTFNDPALMNLGASHATGDAILFLSEEIEVTNSDWLEELIGWIQQTTIGAVGAKLIKPDNTILHSGIVIEQTGFPRYPFMGLFENSMSPFGYTEWYHNYLAVSSNCMIVRRELFEKVGGFNEKISSHCFDIDLCIRMWKMGYRILYTPFVKFITHSINNRITYESQQDLNHLSDEYRCILKLGDPYLNKNLVIQNKIRAMKMRI